jgi:polysaccharide export outer membrane protein
MGFQRASGAGLLARFAFLFVAALLAVWSTTDALAQTPTQEQLDAFQNLSPDQQRAVLEAVRGQGVSTTRRDQPLSAPAPSAPNQAAAASDQPGGPPRIEPASTLLLDVTLIETGRLDDSQNPLMESRRERLMAGNPYRVDDDGRLALPLLPPINVRGLTDEQVAQLLNAEPRLAGLRFSVTLLPIEPSGVEALKPFGYDVFGETPTTFAPIGDIPVPADYRIGPGDSVTIELFGKRTGRYQLVVNREGALVIPEFGPVQVTGLTFDQLRTEIDQRVSEQMIGVRASVTMGELKSIRVFVVGDVARPGAYTVSGLSTITNALFASGGVSRIGSLRNIELKRGGATVARLDLYDLLLRGDTSNDVQLQQGDAIFVPAIGNTAAVTGEVRRPAIYEFRSGTTVGDLIQMAGGLNPQADAQSIRLERVDENLQRSIVDIDFTSAGGRAERLRSGDVLSIPKVLADTRGVTLEGHVQRPGAYAWRQGMRLTDLLGSLQAFKPNADQRYVVIRRESPVDRTVEVLSADAVLAFQERGTQHDPLLQSRDRVIAFSREADRGAVLAELLKELRLQTRDNQPLPIVRIGGRVRAPGEYPLQPGMTVADLIRAGGGLDEAAHGGNAELTRFEVANSEARKTEVIILDLGDATTSNGFALRPYDVLIVKETPEWREQQSVTLVGEVRFPGTYPIRKGETLSSVIARAGGLTEDAFPRGSVFLRKELKEQERQQLESMSKRLRSDLALLALQGSQSPGQKQDVAETLAVGQSLLSQLQTAEPTGRLVIDLEDALRAKSGENDIELRDGDQLIVPQMKQYVTVIGEVQNATTHVYKSGLGRNDYIGLSGGTTSRADTKRIYVVKADGSVIGPRGAFWFDRGARQKIEPGDTVVVPLDADRMRPLPLWTAVTTIIYNMAVAVAAVNSF